MHLLLLFLVCATLLFTAACPAGNSADGSDASADNPADAAVVITDSDRAAAKVEFIESCAPCHGAGGYGNGPSSKHLDPKPRNYHDLTWQASVTDEQIEKTIILGGAAVGKSPAMPSHPQLRSNPVLLGAIREVIRAFGDGKVEPPPAEK